MTQMTEIEPEIETVTVTLEELKANLKHYWRPTETKRLEVTHEGERVATLGLWLPGERRAEQKILLVPRRDGTAGSAGPGGPDHPAASVKKRETVPFFLDSSALVKVLKDEDESTAMRVFVFRSEARSPARWRSPRSPVCSGVATARDRTSAARQG